MPVSPHVLRSEERWAYCNSLIQLAEFLGDNPSLPIPHRFGTSVNVYLDNHEELLKVRNTLGTFEKRYSESYAYIIKSFGPIELNYIVTRDMVCERKLVGTAVVTKRVEVTPATYTTEDTTEDIYEWDCGPLALHPGLSNHDST